MTWPLAPNLDRAVAYPGDPYLNIWILDWDHHALFHRPLSLFHANAFQPARYSLAFSENMFGIAIVLVPFRLAGAGPIVAYNIAMLLGFAFSGFAAYLLGARLTGSPLAGFAAGVFYAFVPFRFIHVTHVQHVWGGWIPMLLLALLAYVDRPSKRTAALFGAAFLMNGLTNVHWLFFGTLSIAAAAAVLAVAGVRRWKELAIATAAASVLLIPFLYPYAAVARLYGTSRSRDETLLHSAQLWDWISRDPAISAERWLFPGYAAIAVSALAVFFLIPRHPRATTFGLLFTILGVAGSLGLNGPFHTFLYEAVPGFQAIRVPARWAAIAYLGMSMLIAATAAHWKRWGAAAVIAALLVVELFPAPIRWYLAVPEAPDVYSWLSRQKLQGAIAELPFDIADSGYLYLLRATTHHQRMVNVVSGFTPPPARKLEEMSRLDPVPEEFLGELRRMGVELLVVHADLLQGRAMVDWLSSEIGRNRIHFVGRFDAGLSGDFVFALGPAGAGAGASKVLDDFLAGRLTFNGDTFGAMDDPPPVFVGKAFFSGVAFSPHGIRNVDFLFENGRVRIPATLLVDPKLTAMFPVYPQTARPRFVGFFPRRPEEVSEETDIQVEIVDGNGKKTRLTNSWFRWEER